MRQSLVSITAFTAMLFAITIISPVVISDSGARQLAGIPAWVILDSTESVKGDGCCTLDPKQGGEVPTCENCWPSHQLNNYPHYVEGNGCEFPNPYRRQYFYCLKMECNEGHYYHRGFQYLGGCAPTFQSVPCPSDTCEKPGLGG